MRGAIASAARCVPLLTATAFPATAQNLSPQEIFRRVAPSVVVVEVKEYPEKGKPRLIASGSGVIVPDRAKDETRFHRPDLEVVVLVGLPSTRLMLNLAILECPDDRGLHGTVFE